VEYTDFIIIINVDNFFFFIAAFSSLWRQLDHLWRQGLFQPQSCLEPSPVDPTVIVLGTVHASASSSASSSFLAEKGKKQQVLRQTKNLLSNDVYDLVLVL
jgi:hypothetical protein